MKGEDLKVANVGEQMLELGRRARVAYKALAGASAETKNAALLEAAAVMRNRSAEIIAANQSDMARAGEAGSSDALLDRLKLNPERIEAMAKGLEVVAA